MAGAEGFEPPKAVLETAGLPLAYAPIRGRAIFSVTEIYLLLRLPVRLMLAAVRAELLQFETFRSRLLVLRSRVVPVLTLHALERNDFSWHLFTFLINPNLINPKSR